MTKELTVITEKNQENSPYLILESQDSTSDYLWLIANGGIEMSVSEDKSKSA